VRFHRGSILLRQSSDDLRNTAALP